jgi:hypothetical protein
MPVLNPKSAGEGPYDFVADSWQHKCAPLDPLATDPPARMAAAGSGGAGAPADASAGSLGPGLLAGRKAALRGFLAPPPVLSRPAPGDKGTFSKVGSNLLFASSPAVVHFGGYTMGKVHEQTIRVRVHSQLCGGGGAIRVRA